MKANELMIGDWVVVHSGYAKVTGITVSGVHFTDRLGVGIASGVEPIPLTAEILEKNGFEYCYEHSYYNHKAYILGGKIYSVLVADSYFTICAEYYVDEFECTDLAEITTIKYVHELQHALRLCGIDKEIVL